MMPRISEIGFHIGSVHLGPLATLLFIVAVAVIGWSAFRLWTIGRGEDRQARIDAMRGGLVRRLEAAPGKPKNPGLYDRLGALVAASAIVGTTERRKMERKLSAAGFRAKTRVA